MLRVSRSLRPLGIGNGIHESANDSAGVLFSYRHFSPIIKALSSITVSAVSISVFLVEGTLVRHRIE